MPVPKIGTGSFFLAVYAEKIMFRAKNELLFCAFGLIIILKHTWNKNFCDKIFVKITLGIKIVLKFMSEDVSD